jgi:integrase
MEPALTPALLPRFAEHLRHTERSPATVKKYVRYARAFLGFAGGQPLSRDLVLAYKRHTAGRYTAAGANGMIAAVNRFLAFLQRPELKAGLLRVQRRLCVPGERELSRAELDKLVAAANGRLALVLQTLFATGARVGELPCITVEAAMRGTAEIHLKGKVRTVFLPTKLCRKLLAYAKGRGIASGAVFVTRSGKPLDRSNIWKAMKALCAAAGVLAAKVFPHNLRKLFARTYYARIPSLAELADVLGHSRVDTTRLYTATTGETYRRKLDGLRLIL